MNNHTLLQKPDMSVRVISFLDRTWEPPRLERCTLPTARQKPRHSGKSRDALSSQASGRGFRPGITRPILSSPRKVDKLNTASG